MSNLSMPIKAILLLSLPVIIATGLIFLLSKRESASVQNQKVGTKEKLVESTTEAQPLPLEPPVSLEVRVADLEASVSALIKKVDVLTKQPAAVVNQTPSTQAPASTTTTLIGPKSVYIPIGTTGSSISVIDFESVTTQEVTIDTNNYPGYKQMVFEANLRIYQANGTGQARLFNKTDGTAILGSLVSTTSANYGLKSSSGFTLPAGNKTYTVQLKSTTGYSVDLQTTRIRVDF